MARNTKPGARKGKKTAAPKAKPAANTSAYPALGRALKFVEKPGAGKAVVYGLGVLVAALFLADFVYYKKTYVDIENVFGFYALYGLATGLVAVIVAKAMRALLKRPEAYYSPDTTEMEAYPEAGLDREARNG